MDHSSVAFLVRVPRYHCCFHAVVGWLDPADRDAAVAVVVVVVVVAAAAAD